MNIHTHSTMRQTERLKTARFGLHRKVFCNIVRGGLG